MEALFSQIHCSHCSADLFFATSRENDNFFFFSCMTDKSICHIVYARDPSGTKDIICIEDPLHPVDLYRNRSDNASDHKSHTISCGLDVSPLARQLVEPFLPVPKFSFLVPSCCTVKLEKVAKIDYVLLYCAHIVISQAIMLP